MAKQRTVKIGKHVTNVQELQRLQQENPTLFTHKEDLQKITAAYIRHTRTLDPGIFKLMDEALSFAFRCYFKNADRTKIDDFSKQFAEIIPSVIDPNQLCFQIYSAIANSEIRTYLRKKNLFGLENTLDIIFLLLDVRDALRTNCSVAPPLTRDVAETIESSYTALTGSIQVLGNPLPPVFAFDLKTEALRGLLFLAKHHPDPNTREKRRQQFCSAPFKISPLFTPAQTAEYEALKKEKEALTAAPVIPTPLPPPSMPPHNPLPTPEQDQKAEDPSSDQKKNRTRSVRIQEAKEFVEAIALAANTDPFTREAASSCLTTLFDPMRTYETLDARIPASIKGAQRAALLETVYSALFKTAETLLRDYSSAPEWKESPDAKFEMEQLKKLIEKSTSEWLSKKEQSEKSAKRITVLNAISTWLTPPIVLPEQTPSVASENSEVTHPARTPEPSQEIPAPQEKPRTPTPPHSPILDSENKASALIIPPVVPPAKENPEATTPTIEEEVSAHTPEPIQETPEQKQEVPSPLLTSAHNPLPSPEKTPTKRDDVRPVFPELDESDPQKAEAITAAMLGREDNGQDSTLLPILQQRDAEIYALQQRMKEMESEIHAMESEIHARDVHIQQLSAILYRRDALIDQQAKELRASTKEISGLKDTISALQTALSALRESSKEFSERNATLATSVATATMEPLLRAAKNALTAKELALGEMKAQMEHERENWQQERTQLLEAIQAKTAEMATREQSFASIYAELARHRFQSHVADLSQRTFESARRRQATCAPGAEAPFPSFTDRSYRDVGTQTSPNSTSRR